MPPRVHEHIRRLVDHFGTITVPVRAQVSVGDRRVEGDFTAMRLGGKDKPESISLQNQRGGNNALMFFGRGHSPPHFITDVEIKGGRAIVTARDSKKQEHKWVVGRL